MTGAGTPLRVQVLGPVRAWRGERELDLGPAQQRMVLAVLALAAGRVVSRIELTDALWDEAPDASKDMLNKFVSLLRDELDPGRAHRDLGQTLVTARPG